MPNVNRTSGLALCGFLFAAHVTQASAEGPVREPSKEQCQAADAIVAEISGEPKPWFSVDGPLKMRTRSSVGPNGWTGRVPNPVILEKLQKGPLASALNCSAVRSIATGKGKLYSEVDGQKQLRLIGLGKVTQKFYRVSVPIVMGGEAVAYLESSSNQLAGGSEVLLLERDAHGRWKVTSRKALTIS